MQPAVVRLDAVAADQFQETAVEIAHAWLDDAVAASVGDCSDDQLREASNAAAELLRQIVRGVNETNGSADESIMQAAGAFARARRVISNGPAVLLRDLELMAELLDRACIEWLEAWPDGAPPRHEIIRTVRRLNHASILLTRVMIRENDDAADRHAAVRQFADMLSHELNTPLNAAGVTAQLLEYTDDFRSPETRRLVTLIRRNLHRADAIMRDVRTAAISADEPVTPERRPFGQVLGDVLAEVHDELVEHGVRLDVEEPIADITVDAPRVKLILVNLVRNAIRYADMRRPMPFVRLACSRNASQGGWWIEVSDNGLGIPTEHQGSVFQRHFRAHPERTDGTGLGLMIVRDEVAQLGGTIDFTSQPGVGTTFRFSLPSSDGVQ